LKLISRIREAGLGCDVMAMPILPWLSDSDEALDSLFAALAAAGATGVTGGALYLKPGTREWFMKWLAEHHPSLVGRYRKLYGQGSYASKEYRTWLGERLSHFKASYGFAGTQGFSHRNGASNREGSSGHEPLETGKQPAQPASSQLALF
jgi:DNA repair photolyase